MNRVRIGRKIIFYGKPLFLLRKFHAILFYGIDLNRGSRFDPDTEPGPQRDKVSRVGILISSGRVGFSFGVRLPV